MNRSCENCARYEAYYRAGAYCFWKGNEGFCKKCEKLVNRDGNCVDFIGAPCTREINVAMIDRAIDDVNCILKKLF